MSSSQPPVEPPLDPSDNGKGIIISCSILAFIATVAVALRFWARRLTRSALALDDYLALSALVLHHALYASGLVSVIKGGLGRDIRIVAAENPEAIVTLFKSQFASEIAYGFSSPTVKLAVLAFYRRMFPSMAVKMGCIVLGSMCIFWTIAIQIVNVIQCRPLMAFWYLELQLLPETRCLDMILYFLGNSIANCVIDFATLILPIREILKLQISNSRKVGICAIFLIGGIAFVASLTRTISTAVIYNEGITNFTKQFVTSGVATVIEIYVAIVGACLPTLIPVYRKLRYGDPLKSRNVSSKGNTSSDIVTIGRRSNRKQITSLGEGPFERLNDEPIALGDYHQNHQVNIRSSVDSNCPIDLPLQGIVVRHDVTN